MATTNEFHSFRVRLFQKMIKLNSLTKQGTNVKNIMKYMITPERILPKISSNIFSAFNI